MHIFQASVAERFIPKVSPLLDEFCLLRIAPYSLLLTVKSRNFTSVSSHTHIFVFIFRPASCNFWKTVRKCSRCDSLSWLKTMISSGTSCPTPADRVPRPCSLGSRGVLGQLERHHVELIEISLGCESGLLLVLFP